MKFKKKTFLIIAISAVLVSALTVGTIFAANSFKKSSVPISAEQSILQNSSLTTSANLKENIPEDKTEETFTSETSTEIPEETSNEVKRIQETETGEQSTNEPVINTETPIPSEPELFYTIPAADYTWTNNYIPTPKNPAILDEAFIQQIKQDAVSITNKPMLKDGYMVSNDYTINDFGVYNYCGTYNGYTIINIFDRRGAYPLMIVQESVAGYDFTYSHGGYALSAYKEGRFFSLQETYENGFLSSKDIQDIAYYHFNYKRGAVN